ncbi:MAG: hypothetical protein CL912_23170 [Deltaproteobacteria bacterium]|nr:hypothetical protein [Deltaproteobacteria bacterium]
MRHEQHIDSVEIFPIVVETLLIASLSSVMIQMRSVNSFVVFVYFHSKGVKRLHVTFDRDLTFEFCTQHASISTTITSELDQGKQQGKSRLDLYK